MSSKWAVLLHFIQKLECEMAVPANKLLCLGFKPALLSLLCDAGSRLPRLLLCLVSCFPLGSANREPWRGGEARGESAPSIWLQKEHFSPPVSAAGSSQAPSTILEPPHGVLTVPSRQGTVPSPQWAEIQRPRPFLKSLGSGNPRLPLVL